MFKYEANFPEFLEPNFQPDKAHILRMSKFNIFSYRHLPLLTCSHMAYLVSISFRLKVSFWFFFSSHLNSWDFLFVLLFFSCSHSLFSVLFASALQFFTLFPNLTENENHYRSLKHYNFLFLVGFENPHF